MQVERYDHSKNGEWDDFVTKSKNGTFLFLRNYMDYHNDRFSDHSLFIRGARGAVIAALPANRREEVVITHEGLTYGGFITNQRMRAATMLEVLDATLAYLKKQECAKFIYKAVPHIYHRIPAEEDLYALFRRGAVLYRRDLTTALRPSHELSLQERRERSIRKARAAGVNCGLSDKYGEFWSLLEHNLWSAHRLKPVHTVEEMCRLRELFPENIKLFCAFLGEEMIAGVVIYETHSVAHAQYTGSSEMGRSVGALDLLFLELISEVYRDKDYFDFGVSTEDQGRYLNAGLVEFKEGFGGRTVTHDFYQIDLAG